MMFQVGNAQFPVRAPIALVLQPAVGILLGAVLEVGLILGPGMLDSLRYTPEEVLARIALQKDVNTFRRQSTAKIMSRKPTKSLPVPEVISADQ